jgi:DNA polymerase-3 subunit alpha
MRLPNAEKWSVAETMEHEREAFGFYFSSHPISQFTQIAASHGAKSYLETIDCGPIPEGSRKSAVIAAMVQSVKWRESGAATALCRPNFQTAAASFRRAVSMKTCASLAEWAKSAECLLLRWKWTCLRARKFRASLCAAQSRLPVWYRTRNSKCCWISTAPMPFCGFKA